MPTLPSDEAWRRLAEARVLLKAKYAQYETWSTPFGAATVITVEQVTSWTM
jgi:hypothetical protein